MRLRWSVPVALVFALAACLPTAAPSADGIDGITRAEASLRATPRDVEFEAFIANVGLQTAFGARADEILDQLRKTRAAAALGLGRSSARGRPGLAAPVLVTGPEAVLVGMPGAFTVLFGALLDRLTAEGRGGQQPRKTSSSTEEGPTSRTTTVLNQTVDATVNGSRVQIVMHWTYQTATTDKASGATLVDTTDDRTIVGVIDVCPSAAGLVPGSLDSHMQSVAAVQSGSNTTRTTTTSSTFSGQVDDRAALGQVVQVGQTSSTWSGGGAGSSGSLTGTLSGAGAMTFDGDRSGTGAAFLGVVQAALVMYGPGGVYGEAEKLWRNGRCVMVTAPDYSVETPLKVSEQEKQQHDEEVDVDSETKFSVSLKHRFGGGALSFPINAELTSGDKKLEPSKLSGSGSLAYKAPAEPEKNAIAQLKSTSKRGIGTLVVGFHTVGKHLKLSIKGTLRQPFGPFTYVANISIGPADFQKVDATAREATGAVNLTIRVEGLPIPCEIAFTGSGTAGLAPCSRSAVTRASGWCDTTRGAARRASASAPVSASLDRASSRPADTARSSFRPPETW